MEEKFDIKKNAVLDHVQELFDEMEKEMAISHQEKYAMLEDMLGSAVDEDEIQVAFEQWYHEHSDDVDFEHDLDELWSQMMARMEE